MANENKKILIIRLSALGDTIHTLPLLSALRELYGESAQIDWIVEDKSAEFILNNPLINNVFVVPKKQWRKRKNKIKNLFDFISIISRLRKTNYDIIIDVQQLLKSAVWMFLAKGRRKIMQDKGREFSFLAANEIIITDRLLFDINYHVVERNLDIARYLGWKGNDIKFVLPQNDEAIVKSEKFLSECDKTKPNIVVAPSTTWNNKHWINDCWSGLINIFSQKANIIVTGTSADKELNERIIKRANAKVIDLTGKTTLKELREILNKADIVISPDSGTAHIAWATGHPHIVSLFFSTSSKRTAPFGEKYISFQAKTPCSPCMKRKCKFKYNKENCRREINFNEIVNIVNKILTSL